MTVTDSQVRTTQQADDAEVLYRRPGRADLDPVGHRRRQRWITRVLAWGTPVVVLLAWQWCAQTGVVDDRFFPQPTAVWSRGVEMIREGELHPPLLRTLKSVAIGFTAGVLVGYSVGAVTGMNRWFRAAFEPILSALYTVPKLAIFPLLLLIFGLGETPKIMLIALTAFFFVWIQTMASFMSIPMGYREAANAFGASQWQLFRHVLFPASLPQVFVAIRIAIGVALLVAIAMEFVNGGVGIGWMIWNSWQLFTTERMYVGIVTVSVTGVLLMSSVKLVARLVMPWADSTETERL